MSSKQELVYATTGHHINKYDGITDVTFAYSLYNGIPTRQEQLVRAALAVVEMDSRHIEHSIMAADRGSPMNDLYQDIFEIQGMHIDQNLSLSKVGRKALAVANLYTGSYDQDGFELIMIEPFQNSKVIDLLNKDRAYLNDPEHFSSRIWVR